MYISKNLVDAEAAVAAVAVALLTAVDSVVNVESLVVNVDAVMMLVAIDAVVADAVIMILVVVVVAAAAELHP